MVEVCALLMLLLLWGLTWYYYPSLPETIPTHFNAKGDADGFGRKATILMLPAVATVLFAGMTILNRYPHVFNYPVKITEANALQQYSIATGMIRWLKLVIMLVFTLIVIRTHAAASDGSGIGRWFLPVTLLLIFVPVIFSLVRIFRARG